MAASRGGNRRYNRHHQPSRTPVNDNNPEDSIVRKIFFTVLLMIAISGIIVAQKIDTSGNTKATAAAQTQGRQLDLLAGTQLSAQLQSALDARHAKVGDRVIFKTTEALKQNGKVVVPRGAQVLGRVTDIQPYTNESAESHISLLIDELRSGSTEIPINATILSITQASSHTQANNSNLDSDLMNQSSASTRSSSPPQNNNSAGLLGGVGNTGGVVNTTTATAGNVAGATTNAVGSTVGATTNGTGNLAGSLRELRITQSTNASARGESTLSLTGNNLRLESGTTFNLAISNSAGPGNP